MIFHHLKISVCFHFSSYFFLLPSSQLTLFSPLSPFLSPSLLHLVSISNLLLKHFFFSCLNPYILHSCSFALVHSSVSIFSQNIFLCSITVLSLFPSSSRSQLVFGKVILLNYNNFDSKKSFKKIRKKISLNQVQVLINVSL